MVWRGRCDVNPEPITDYVGEKHSLMELAKRDREKALRLLKNRYYIMLTRGIRGTYIYTEDKETGEALKKYIEKAVKSEAS